MGDAERPLGRGTDTDEVTTRTSVPPELVAMTARRDSEPVTEHDEPAETSPEGGSMAERHTAEAEGDATNADVTNADKASPQTDANLSDIRELAKTAGAPGASGDTVSGLSPLRPSQAPVSGRQVATSRFGLSPLGSAPIGIGSLELASPAAYASPSIAPLPEAPAPLPEATTTASPVLSTAAPLGADPIREATDAAVPLPEVANTPAAAREAIRAIATNVSTARKTDPGLSPGAGVLPATLEQVTPPKLRSSPVIDTSTRSIEDEPLDSDWGTLNPPEVEAVAGAEREQPLAPDSVQAEPTAGSLQLKPGLEPDATAERAEPFSPWADVPESLTRPIASTEDSPSEPLVSTREDSTREDSTREDSTREDSHVEPATVAESSTDAPVAVATTVTEAPTDAPVAVAATVIEASTDAPVAVAATVIEASTDAPVAVAATVIEASAPVAVATADPASVATENAEASTAIASPIETNTTAALNSVEAPAVALDDVDSNAAQAPHAAESLPIPATVAAVAAAAASSATAQSPEPAASDRREQAVTAAAVVIPPPPEPGSLAHAVMAQASPAAAALTPVPAVAPPAAARVADPIKRSNPPSPVLDDDLALQPRSRLKTKIIAVLWLGSLLGAGILGWKVAGSAAERRLSDVRAANTAEVKAAREAAIAETKAAIPPPPAHLDLRVPADLRPLSEIVKSEPGKRTRAEAVAMGRQWQEKRFDDLNKFIDELRRNPQRLDDWKVRVQILDVVRERTTSRIMLELLSDLPSPRALDLLYEIWIGSKDRNETTQLAEALLLANDVRKRISGPLELALNLREKPTDCGEIQRLVAQAIREGDRRSSNLLVTTAPRRNCGPSGDKDCVKCLNDVKDMRKAIRASAARPDPVQWSGSGG